MKASSHLRPRSNRAGRAATMLAGAALLIGGCTSSGLSARDKTGLAYPNFVQTLVESQPDGGAGAKVAGATGGDIYATTSGDVTTAPVHVTLPISVAVVQAGEVAPPQSMLDALAKNHAAIGRVNGIPWPMPDPSDQQWQRWQEYQRTAAKYTWQNPPQPDAKDYAQRQTQQLRRVARQVGADYVFVFGGTLDQAVTETPLSALDLTIVGMFVVPSRHISSEGRAAGALVDARSGRVVLTVSADSRGDTHAPRVAVENDQLKQGESLRDQLVDKLAKRLGEQLASAAATTPPLATPAAERNGG